MGFGRRKEGRSNSRPLSTILPEGLKFFTSRASNSSRRLQPAPSRTTAAETDKPGVFPGTAYRDSQGSSMATSSHRQSRDNASLAPSSVTSVRQNPQLPPSPPLDMGRPHETQAQTQTQPWSQTDVAQRGQYDQKVQMQPFEPLTLDFDSHAHGLGLPQELLGSSESLPSIRPVTGSTGEKVSFNTSTNAPIPIREPTPEDMPILATPSDLSKADTTAGSSDTADISTDIEKETEKELEIETAKVGYAAQVADEPVKKSASSSQLSFVRASAAASSSSTIIEQSASEVNADSMASTLSSSATSIEGLTPPPLKLDTPEVSTHLNDETESDDELYHFVQHHQPLTPIVLSAANERKIVVNHGVYIFGENTLGREVTSGCLEDGFEAYDFE